MIFLNIENEKLLTKIITYLDLENIKYTFNRKDNIKYVVIDKINKKNINFINNYKTILITYTIEDNFNNELIDKLSSVLNKCYKIIVSIEYMKQLLKKIKTDVIVIHREIPLIKYNKKDTKVLKNKYIVINDPYLYNLDIVYDIVNKFNYKYYYVGYNKLSKTNNKIYDNLKNTIKLKYIDYDLYKDIVKNSYLVIDFNENTDIKNIQIPILYKKNLIMKEIDYYDKYLISNKEIYTFSNKKELMSKIKKIIENRLSDLTEEAYFKISNDNCKVIATKFAQILQ